MYIKLLLPLVFVISMASGQTVGPPNNVGREYGNPKMPWVVSHLAGANRERLKRANKYSHHGFFGKVLCFRKVCRIQSGHPASLRSPSFKKFKRKITRHGRKGVYEKMPGESPSKTSSITPSSKQFIADSVDVRPVITVPEVKTDTLIVLGAEVLFETNEADLRKEHFGVLKSIADYLIRYPGRTVVVSGHTDNSGSESHNVTLSKQRADIVAQYLANNGVDAGRIESYGSGSAKPIASNSSEAGRRKNRRVELLIRD